MTYEELLSDGRIRRFSPTPREISGLLGVGRVRLRHLQEHPGEADVRLELAYDVARAAAEAVMAAEGYRPTSAENHRTIFAFLALVDGGRWAEEASFFDRSRSLRHLSVYAQNGAISDTEADELLERARGFWNEVAKWIAEQEV